MMNEIIDLFSKIVSSKLWYLLTSLGLIFLLRFAVRDVPKEASLEKKVQRTAQLTIFFAVMSIFLANFIFAVLIGLKKGLVSDVHTVMVIGTGVALLGIYLVYLVSRLTRKQGKPEIEEGWACVYTTNNEHEAQLVRVGLEGEGIKVILQRKSAANTPNSLIHQLEIYVFEKDKDKAIKLLPKFRP